ncbi:MAG: hypothetical protein U0359_14255 [Byssovorax sp.]
MTERSESAIALLFTSSQAEGAHRDADEERDRAPEAAEELDKYDIAGIACTD